jgi:hypothetical protein
MQMLKQRFARALLREWRRRKPAGHSTFWNEALDAGHAALRITGWAKSVV